MFIFWQIPLITKPCFQNIWKPFHKFLLKKYSKDIPGILQGYENVFRESKSWKYCFVGYPVKILILAVSSLAMFLWTLLKPIFTESKELRVVSWKGSYQCLAAGKDSELAQHYYQYITLL